MNNIRTILFVALVSVLASACGQAVQKAPVFGESDHIVPTEAERAQALQLNALDRAEDAQTKNVVHLITVANHERVTDEEPPTKIYRAIQARTSCTWQVTGRDDLGSFLTQDDAYEAGVNALPPIPENVDGELVISVGVHQACGLKHTYTALN